MSTNFRVAQADNGLLKYEAGQEYVATQAMTDSGDHTTYSITDAPWSDAPGKSPVILPDGLLTGGAITPGNSGKVSVASATAYIGGTLRSPAAMTGASGVDLTQTAGGHLTHSITIFDDGGTYKFKSTAGATHTSHTNERGGAGGPPLILADEVEIGWVRTIGDTAGVVDAADILQIVEGLHYERSDSPMFDIDYENGEITFNTALPASHTGPATKDIYATVYTPVMVAQKPTSNVKLPEITHSSSSTAVYEGAITSLSRSLGQGSFTTYLRSGVSEERDPILKVKDQKIWWQFFPSKYREDESEWVQATLGIARTFPADGNITAECTLTP